MTDLYRSQTLRQWRNQTIGGRIAYMANGELRHAPTASSGYHVVRRGATMQQATAYAQRQGGYVEVPLHKASRLRPARGKNRIAELATAITIASVSSKRRRDEPPADHTPDEWSARLDRLAEMAAQGLSLGSPAIHAGRG